MNRILPVLTEPRLTWRRALFTLSPKPRELAQPNPRW